MKQFPVLASYVFVAVQNELERPNVGAQEERRQRVAPDAPTGLLRGDMLPIVLFRCDNAIGSSPYRNVISQADGIRVRDSHVVAIRSVKRQTPDMVQDVRVLEYEVYMFRTGLIVCIQLYSLVDGRLNTCAKSAAYGC